MSILDPRAKLAIVRYLSNSLCSILQDSWYPSPGTLVKFPSENGAFKSEPVEYVRTIDLNSVLWCGTRTEIELFKKFQQNELNVRNIYVVTSINFKREFSLIYMRYITNGSITLMSELGKTTTIHWGYCDRISLIGFIGLLKVIDV